MTLSKLLGIVALAAVPGVAININPRIFEHGRQLNSKRDHTPGYWLDHFQQVLQTMQNTFWNGTYWPSTIQWEGAVLNMFLSASDRSFLEIITGFHGIVPGGNTSASSLQTEIQTYFTEVKAYFGDEDTDQIFNSAFDDAQWVVLEWLEAIKFIEEYDSAEQSTFGSDNVAEFAHRAHVFYNIVQNQFDTSLCGGGITWNPALAPYKNAVANELLLDTSIGMYLYFPGDSNTDPYPSADYEAIFGSLPPLPTVQQHDPSLLQLAIDEYNWFKSQPFLDPQGLIIDGFHLSPNQTTCNQPNPMIYSYNQGILLSGLRQLWESTGDTSYLTDGYQHIWSTINATRWFVNDSAQAGIWGGLGRFGVMEDYCDAPANCSQDNLIFKGVYFDHLDSFCTPLPTEQATIPGLTFTATQQLASDHESKCAEYAQWVEHNAQAALSTLVDGSGIIGGWWGVNFVNRSHGPEQPAFVQRPIGVDIENHPSLLTQTPWKCLNGQRGCDPHSRHGAISLRRMLRMKRDSEQRTAETQASGLGVVRAASDLSLLSARAW